MEESDNCSYCGEGTIRESSICDFCGILHQKRKLKLTKCLTCDGAGYFPGLVRECPDCHGEGNIEEE